MQTGRRLRFGLIMGVGGFALLILLGVWQATKYIAVSDQIPQLEARMEAEPLQLGRDPLPEDADYRRAEAVGRFVDMSPLRLGVTHMKQGGDILINAFELTSGGRILVQRGFAPEGWAAGLTPPTGEMRVIGVLVDPQEVGYFTPEPDFEQGVIFARDVPAMAAHFGAEPILLVEGSARLRAARYPEPIPVEVAIPNNHLGYAVTWFALAAIWAGMTALLIFGRGRREDPSADG